MDKKRCYNCKAICSDSATKCRLCGSKNFVKKINDQSKTIQCSLCCSPVPIKNGKGYCVYCDDEIYDNR